jgi:hypothetical protein
VLLESFLAWSSLDAEQNIAQTLDRNRFELEMVHLGNDKSRLTEAESAGVKSVPALVIATHFTPITAPILAR